MDITRYWPFNIVEEIPKDSVLIVDTGKIMKRKDVTPKNIGKGYTFVGEYPLLASERLFKRMKKAKDTNNPSLLPKYISSGKKPMSTTYIPQEIWDIISSGLPVKDIVRVMSANKSLYKYMNDPEVWKFLLERDYPDVVQYYGKRNKEVYRVLTKFMNMIKKNYPNKSVSKNVLRVIADNVDREISFSIDEIENALKRQGIFIGNEIIVPDILPELWGKYKPRDDINRYNSYLSIMLQNAYNKLWTLKDMKQVDDMDQEERMLILVVANALKLYVLGLQFAINRDIGHDIDVLGLGRDFFDKLRSLYSDDLGREHSYLLMSEELRNKTRKLLLNVQPNPNYPSGSVVSWLNHGIPYLYRDKSWLGALDLIHNY